VSPDAAKQVGTGARNESKNPPLRTLKQSGFLRDMLAGIRWVGFSCRAAWVGVNEKNLENKKRRLRFPTARSRDYFFKIFLFFLEPA